MHKKSMQWLAPFIIYLSIPLLALRDFIFSGSGTSINGWIGSPYNFSATRLSPFAWNVQLGRQENLTQFIFNSIFSPFVEIAKIIGSDMFVLLPWILIIFFLIAGFSAYLFCREILFSYRVNERMKRLICILCGAYYLSYPFFAIGEIYELPTFIGYCLFPLVIFFFLRAYRTNSYQSGIAAAMIGSLISFADLRYLILTLFVILAIPLIRVLMSRHRLVELRNKLPILLVVIISFGLIAGPSLFIYSMKESGANQIPLNGDSIAATWSQANPLTILNGYSWFQLNEEIDWSTSFIPYEFMMLVALLPVVVALIGVVKRKKIDQDTLFLLIISIGVWALFCVPSFTQWLVLDSPGNEFIGRMFRAPRIPAQLISVGVTGLLAIGLTSLMDFDRPFTKGNWRKFPLPRAGMVLSVFLVVMILLTSLPLIQFGSPNEYLDTVVQSDEFIEVNEVLDELSGRSLWFPFDLAPQWYESISGVRLFNNYNSLGATMVPNDNRWVHFSLYLNSNFYYLLMNDVGALSNILRANGFSYIVISNETSYSSVKLSTVHDAFLNSEYFDLEFGNEGYMVFRLADALEMVSVAKIATIGGGYTTYQRIAQLMGEEYLPSFLDDQVSPSELEISSVLAISGNKNEFDLIYPYLEDEWTYALAPLDSEGAKYITDPHHGSWHGYLGGIGEHLWEFGEDFNYGLFSFESVNNFNLAIDCDVSTDHQVWVRALMSGAGGNLTFFIDGELITRISTCTDSTASAEFQWIKIADLPLTSGSHEISVESDSANNALNVITVLPTEDYENCLGLVTNDLLRKRIITVLEVNPNGIDNFTVQTDLWIPNNASTVFAWRGGECSIEIDSSTIDIDNYDSVSGWNYSDPVDIQQGVISINVDASESSGVNDYIIVMQSPEETSFDDFFETRECGHIIMIKESGYELEFNATLEEGDVLVFSESFHELWEITGNESIWNHIPISGTINGYINSGPYTGELTIAFSGQEDYAVGYWLFVITISAFVGYIIIYKLYKYVNFRRADEGGEK